MASNTMTDFRKQLKREKRGSFYMNERLVFGDYAISIQCGDHSYCTPRQGGLPFEQYSEMEVATFHNDTWCIIKGFEQHYDTHGRYDPEDMPSTSVCGYMSIEDIQRLVDHLAEGNVECTELY